MTKNELKEKIEEFCEKERLDEKSSKTVVDYKNCLNKFYEYIDNDKIEFTKEFTIKYKLYLKDQLESGQAKVSSINKYVVVFNKFLKYLDEDYKKITIKQFRTQQKSSLENQMSNQEHKRMLRKAKELGKEELYMIIKTFAQTAIRISELRYFTVENIKKGPYIDIYSKGKERKIILIGDLHRSLKKYCKENNITEGFIFRSPDPKLSSNPNKMINQSTIWRWLKKIAKKAKINSKKMHPHAWRHLFAKQCKATGIDLDELADILGHKNLNTTAIYTKTSMKEKKNKLERIRY